jgi:hypothetical protein
MMSCRLRCLVSEYIAILPSPLSIAFDSDLPVALLTWTTDHYRFSLDYKYLVHNWHFPFDTRPGMTRFRVYKHTQIVGSRSELADSPRVRDLLCRVNSTRECTMPSWA